MAIIKGNAVANATSYELYEVEIGYTVTIRRDANTTGCVLLLDGVVVDSVCSDGDVVYSNVKVVELQDNGDEEADYITTEEVIEWLYEGRSKNLREDIVITNIQH